jgi:hypothetical protein
MLADDRPPARERLDREVGDRLAALLCAALVGAHARQHSWLATVGSASSGPATQWAGIGYLELLSFRPEPGRTVASHPERSTGVSLGKRRSTRQRTLWPVGASRTRALKAALNDRLQHEKSTAAASAGRVELACECDDDACHVPVVLAPEEYAFLRSVPGYHAVSPDHVRPDDRVIVGDSARFAIVE